MEWIKTTGATLDEAKERALDRLGVAEDELEYEVLVEAGRTMLGLRRTEARMRARVRPTSPRPKVDRRDRNRRGDRKRGRNGGSGKNARSEGRSEASGKNARSEGRNGGSGKNARSEGRSEASGKNARSEGRNGGSGKNARSEGRSEASGRGRGSNGGGRDGGRSGGRGGNGGSGGRGGKGDKIQTSAGNGRDNREEKADVEKMDLETQAEITEGFLTGLLDRMGLDARVASSVDEDRLTVEAHGLNLGLAIGQGGETVRAITELARTIVQRRSHGSAAGSLVVDVGGYRERRRSFLEDFTRSQAEAVLADGRARALEPMAAADRKVVHDTVAEMDGVVTASEGSDSDRRVVILADTAG